MAMLPAEKTIHPPARDPAKTTRVRVRKKKIDVRFEDDLPAYLPDHTQLPESDGVFVKNFQERPQGDLLSDSILPVLYRLHPDEHFIIGQDSGIYWRLPEPPEPLVAGALAPDWFYVPNVPPKLNGIVRKSYVLWKEFIRPVIAIEFVSGNGSEERDRTPRLGKFWIYENAICPTYYAIYEVTKASVEVYRLESRQFERMSPNRRGHFPIEPMGVELGIWPGKYENLEYPWLRWWDEQGKLLLTSNERAEQEAQRAEQEAQRAAEHRQRAERLAAQLRALGIEPEA
jgi:hypothetical protein